MNWNEVERRWMEVAGSFHEKFGELTSDVLEQLDGKKNRLVDTLQEKCGHSQEDAERCVEDWRQSLGDDGQVPTSTSGASTY